MNLLIPSFPESGFYVLSLRCYSSDGVEAKKHRVGNWASIYTDLRQRAINLHISHDRKPMKSIAKQLYLLVARCTYSYRPSQGQVCIRGNVKSK